MTEPQRLGERPLFGTKTPYLKARQELHRHEDVTFPIHGPCCKPAYIYFLCRHAIRYPMKDQYAHFRRISLKMKENLLAAGRLDAALDNELRSWKFAFEDDKAELLAETGKEEAANVGK